MNNPIAAYKPQNDIALAPVAQEITMGFGSAAGFELMQRGAKLLMAASLVPKDYQNNISNCVVALNMANRLGADPLMVMQNLYVVHGRPSWSAQFLIASFNQCGRFSAIRYRWSGTEGKDDWGCQAYATERSAEEIITGPLITIETAKKEGWYGKSGSKWQTIPQLMLMYRAASWLVRTHAPEISMGLQTAEEIHDVFDAEQDGAGNFSVGEGTRSMMDKIKDVTGESINTKTGEVLQSEAIIPAEADQKRTAKFSDVSASLQSAKTLDELNEAYDLAREVKNPVHREQLDALYQAREAALK